MAVGEERPDGDKRLVGMTTNGYQQKWREGA